MRVNGISSVCYSNATIKIPPCRSHNVQLNGILTESVALRTKKLLRVKNLDIFAWVHYWERDKGLVPVVRACVKFYWNPGKIVLFGIF